MSRSIIFFVLLVKVPTNILKINIQTIKQNNLNTYITNKNKLNTFQQLFGNNEILNRIGVQQSALEEGKGRPIYTIRIRDTIQKHE